MILALATVAVFAIPGDAGPNLYLKYKLDLIRARNNVPGMSACLVVDGRIVAAAASGKRRYGGPYDVKVTDPFRIGSVSKIVTGHLTGVLMEKHPELTWNTTMKQIYPTMASWPACKSQYLNATFAHLMKHEAGMPYRPNYDPADCFQSVSPTEKGRRHAYVQSAVKDLPLYPLGTKQIYEGGPIVVASMLETRFNDTYLNLLRANVFNPLGMSTAGWGKTAQSSDTTGATGVWEHKLVNGKPQPDFNDTPHSAVHGPAGNVTASAVDMGKFIAALLYNATKGTRIISTPMLKKMFTWDTFRCSPSGFFKDPSPNGGMPVLAHNGDNGNQYCHMIACPEDNYGFWIGANMSGDAGHSAVSSMVPILGNLEKHLAAVKNFDKAVMEQRSVNASSQTPEHKFTGATDYDFMTYWQVQTDQTKATLTLQFMKPTAITACVVDEFGAKIKSFSIETSNSATGPWKQVAKLTTCGKGKLVLFSPTTVNFIRLNILDSSPGPSIWEFQAYKFG